MDKQFVGRELEIKQLKKIESSGKAEFVAVYGRRRVGKTYLIQHYFDKSFSFETTGILDGKAEEQMFAFRSALKRSGYDGKLPRTWLEAFECLKTVLESKDIKGRRVIYIDELPCLDTPKSGFVRALGYFWNSWASLQKDVILIVCGSATSWMVENIINDHGGLHDRITHTIYLHQFTLAETERYLSTHGMKWPRQTIVETYMVFGGVPYYLSLLDSQFNLAQNIDRLYFRKNAELANEYYRLYSSLFKSPDAYIKIVELLSQNKKGLSRQEIVEKLGGISSGNITKQLQNLENCDIIRKYSVKSKGKLKVKDSYYQLMDFFSLFHLTFSNKATSDGYWEQRVNTPAINSWQGLAFEHVCMCHIAQIRQALGLSRIAVEYYSWRSNEAPRAQIDMVIERADHLVNLCEIKYTKSEYSITAEDDHIMRNKSDAFVRGTGSHCGILPTWITTYGLKRNMYSEGVQYQASMDDLFKDVSML